MEKINVCKNYRRIYNYGRYVISRDGDVCSLSYDNTEEPKLLKTFMWYGKPSVTLYNKDGRENKSIEELLAQTFGKYDYSHEEWRDIEGLDGYQVSDMGRVRTLNYRGTGAMRLLKFSRVQDYYRISIKGKSYAISRLVASAFIPNDDPIHKTDVDHINQNKRCNLKTNLRWVSHSENIKASKIK